MAAALKIALVGNPNSGKSSLFNALTGLRQKVGNFPGVTVDRKKGGFHLPNGQLATLTDLPGTYNIYPKSEDEAVATHILIEPSHPDRPDIVVVVADVTNLRRGLMLCTQVMDMGHSVVLALNMMDLLSTEGSRLDLEGLRASLGIPIVPISARNGEGLAQLKASLERVPAPAPRPFFSIPASFDSILEPLEAQMQAGRRYLAWQAHVRPDLFPALGKSTETQDALIANELAVRYDKIQGLLERVLLAPATRAERITDKMDKVLLHPVAGYLIFAGMLFLIFQAVFAWAAIPMDWIDTGFSKIGSWMGDNLPDHLLSRLFVDGIWAGLGGIVVFVPQIAFLFFFISLLEDSGYMSRAVFLMDRLVKPFGFSGRSVIPLIGGMACAVPSIMMARNIPDKTERLITILATPFMSCSARIPVYVLLISIFVPEDQRFGIFNMQGLVMAGMYLLGFLMALAVAFVIKTIRRYKSTAPFVTELPVFRMPRWRNTGLTMYHKSRTFVVEAGKVILLVSVLLWVLQSFGPPSKMVAIENQFKPLVAAAGEDSLKLAELEEAQASAKLRASYAGMVGQGMEPLIRPLGFDWKIGIALLSSFAAREVFVGTMATLYSAGPDAAEDEGGRFKKLRAKMALETHPDTGKPVYTLAVAVSLLVFYAFAMQCLSTVAVVQRETKSWKIAIGMLAYMTLVAYGAAFLAFQLFS
jgi:ferrous iron transport protein B